ncbi:MAG: Holliday junction branch migration protein RuvA, partial [Candidatus Omnitrophica bacterium]|nr:Holliday junction branch migration protein RuvA [Candidatus Omnitrophota bacterium]
TLFKLLISISGIGPKIAMTILSGLSISDLKRAIVDGSIHVLTGISGVGRKTAERIIIELREKLVLEERRADQPVSLPIKAEDQLFEDTLQALIQLGYRRQNARDAIQKVLRDSKSEKLSVENLIRESLKHV